MPSIKLFIVILSMLTIASGCKNDGKNSSDIVLEGNNISVLSSLGAVDMSNLVLARQDAQWPENVAQTILFKSEGFLNSYCETSPNEKNDFTKNDLLLLVGKKIDHGVDFIADSIVTTKTPHRIYLSTRKNKTVKSTHRPHLALSLPKASTASMPDVYLDKIQVGGMVFADQ